MVVISTEVSLNTKLLLLLYVISITLGQPCITGLHNQNQYGQFLQNVQKPIDTCETSLEFSKHVLIAYLSIKTI